MTQKEFDAAEKLRSGPGDAPRVSLPRREPNDNDKENTGGSLFDIVEKPLFMVPLFMILWPQTCVLLVLNVRMMPSFGIRHEIFASL